MSDTNSIDRDTLKRAREAVRAFAACVSEARDEIERITQRLDALEGAPSMRPPAPPAGT